MWLSTLIYNYTGIDSKVFSDKTLGLTELKIVFSLGGGRGKPWVSIINYVLLSCVQPRNRTVKIFFIRNPIGAITVFPTI